MTAGSEDQAAVSGAPSAGPKPPSHGDHAKRRPQPAAPEPRRPYHVGVAVGLSTGIYAVSLLATSRLQIATDRKIIEDRTPVEAAISALGDHHDWMDDRLDEARTDYSAGATAYGALAARLESMARQLAGLDTVVGSVERLANSIPTTITLPALRPASGSGGTSTKSSGGASGGGTAGGTTKPVPVAPRATAPPPTSGQTGASGAP